MATMGRAPVPAAPAPAHAHAEMDAYDGPPPPTYELSTMGSPAAGSSSMAGSSAGPAAPAPALMPSSNDNNLSFDPSQAPDFSRPDLGLPMAAPVAPQSTGNTSNNPFHNHTNTDMNTNNSPYQPQGGMSPFPPPTSSNPPSNIPQSTVGTIPLGMLQKQSAAVLCPSCNVRSHTYIEPKAGKYIHTVACVCCCFTLMGCLAYCFSGLKDTHHKCGSCGVSLATFHRGGRTEVHRYSK